MKHLLIILSIILLYTPLFGQETGVLYLWENGTKYVGEWKNGKEWNITLYEKNGNIIGRFVDGVKQ